MDNNVQTQLEQIRLRPNTIEIAKPEQFLEGISFDYQYQNETGINIRFEREHLFYKWVKAPNKNKPVRKMTYLSLKLESQTYLAQWH